MPVLPRVFFTLVALSAGSFLYVLLCPRFCVPLCWLSCRRLEEEGREGRLLPEAPSDAQFAGYISVPEGKPLARAPCRHCAVVSSSGQMLGSRSGKEIDAKECVLRMNQAPTQGFEEDVGGRSTVRVVSHTSIPLLLRNQSYFFARSRDTLYVVWGPPRLMSREKTGLVYRALLKVKEMYPSLRLYTLTEEMMAHCDALFQMETGKDRMKSGSFLSTGWFTMVLAMELCEQIFVFGMVSESYCRNQSQPPVPYHYFEKGRLDECRMYLAHERAPRGGHRFITEKAVFSRWAKKRNIVFTHPSWPEG
ncbi:alpha-N-acetyl-neuraminyl-2,3-beta-galactosyl-1,3-N-acetyl-galactosaminide alpha-2,6-sialyltransferase isoform X2 [Anolis carolinensis]|uniref:alpha-N-acetyl-neuraminyl-2,3-beta-galactosyl-1, 3-N-acetyl-galactosaminide alpha-2,6-sialyltransferase isoform X2 n=1 Tax=Anolis carolinensis TaxID=28377 RepID=UPI000462AEEF|nr:PREDICTED: alpha-N-acetyl-neuraminyl-2,3-beta-galactosyl-1,3-N-acetyl-galactosaminide alpha-2,6-sialyltransferase [Anolis carolinensis]|eukprot:XP_003230768.2 PREDICTED: alpha-N-acetyl-neuraminyl-2,3-beta-galactosyl-1,3-N-acetyl-galactosaminide alpha-2,6-sialyltransferase [Anolis carolinensis]